MRTLILGGARSGKSAHAEKLATDSGKRIVYIATAQAGDAEMAARIARHRQDRDQAWITVEETMALGQAIRKWSSPENLVLVDCLTVWLSNLLFSAKAEYPEIGEISPPEVLEEQRSGLLETLDAVEGDVIIVSNEVGLGIVPLGAVSRWFVDEAGRLNQAVAARCDRAILMAAGLPLVLKGG